ncbi:Gfo/Idh/MocA family protein [Enterococcus saccharolyticus]|uniref:Gfo/Idh/MocA family protein n=1 Tax=Enterococcus saccharolyticus TaxID=41997 RepID=UPI0039E13C5D
MKIGVIGLGGIAQKAYLPTYVKLQDQATFYFATRNPEVQQQLQEKYQLRYMKANVQELLAEKIDACFIHTATHSHYDLVKECLENDVHVFVDKPLSENTDEVKELQALAKKRHKILMVGFNRRFAPMVEQLKNMPDKRTIFLQKNMVHSIQPTTFEIFDVFLHLVDTAVYLLDEPILTMNSRIRDTPAGMETAFLQLETENTTAMLSMDLKSGASREQYQVTSSQGTAVVDNLVTLQTFNETQQTTQTFGDWEVTLKKRGFEQMVTSFLEAIQTQTTTKLRQENIVISHELCAKMLKQHEEQSN